MEPINELLDLHQLYVNSLGKDGKKLCLDECKLIAVDVKGCSLSGAFIVSSTFQDVFFENVEIFDARLCSCEFENVTFINVKFVKADLDHCVFRNCKFIDTTMYRCDSIEVMFEDCRFLTCDSDGSFFDYAALKDILFGDMNFYNFKFYETAMERIRFENVKMFDVDKVVFSLNAGTFENAEILKGEPAIEHFKNNCKFE